MADNPLEEKAIVPTATTSIVNVPMPSKEPGQRSINITDLFITRWTPPWSRPPSLPAYTWRAWVMNQPVAIACREALISMLSGMDWIIAAKDSDDKDELAATIKYYTKLFSRGGYYMGTDWSGFLEWVLGDLLDIPFGGATEIGRKGDDPKGRVVWLRPLDGGTLYPTLNLQFPVVQYYQGYTAVAFPEHAVSRLMMTPRPEIFREGWGIAPPEKIYFALDMLNRGDKYYANLLLDVPPAGILDLGDMEETSAKAWVDSFRNFVANTTDAFRIPVLYEHNNEVKFLPFGKVPNDIMYDHITLKYAALVCAAYGIALNDIGLQGTSKSGETLAGSIRASVQTRRSGIARLKQKVKGFIEKILPDNLIFEWVDYDDEHNVAMGRARLASATGLNLLVTGGSISPEEARMQMIKDGLIDIPIGDKLPPDAKPVLPAAPFGGGATKPAAGGKPAPKPAPKNPGALGHGVPPSMGGEGEIKKSFIIRSRSAGAVIDQFVQSVVSAIYPKVLQNIYQYSDDEIILSKSIIDDGLFGGDITPILVSLSGGKPKLSLNQGIVEKEPDYESTNLFKDEKKRKDFQNRLKDGINGMLAKSIAEELNNVLYDMAVQDIAHASFEETEEENQFDYYAICEQVKSRVSSNLDRTLDSFIRSLLPVVPTMVNESAIVEKSEPVEKMETVTAVPTPPITQTINFPPINVTVPERSVIVAPPDVQMFNSSSAPASPDVHITNYPPALPEIHVNVEPTAVQIPMNLPDVHVNVEKSDLTPNITVNVPENPVTVNVPAQATPVVNVDVSPTPITIENEVNLPEKKSKHVEIKKNPDGSWSGESS